MQYCTSSEHCRLLLKSKECFLVMSRNHLAFGDPLQMLQSLRASKPGGMISGQPPLRLPVPPLGSFEARQLGGSNNRAKLATTYILNDMAMIAGEEECPSVRHVDLHPHKPICMARKMMQSDSLTEVECLLVERLPIPDSLLAIS